MEITNTKLFFNIRRLVYTVAGIFDGLTGSRNNLFIFCYHAVGNDDWRYGVTKEMFEKQMRFLLKSYNAVTLTQVENYIKGKQKLNTPSFAVAFDDGYKDILQLIPLVKELNIRPTVFVLGDTKKADRTELENDRPFLNRREINTLRKAGWEIQSHGMTHAFLPTAKDLEYEINDSKADFKYFAYPKGGYTDDVMKVVKSSGYSMALSMDAGFINQKTNIFAVPRVGVDRSHSFEEFKYSFSPTVIKVKSLYKPVDNLLGKFKK